MRDGKSTSSCVILHWIPHYRASSMGFNLKGFISTSQTDMYSFRIFQFTCVSIMLRGRVEVPSHMMEQLISIQTINLSRLRSTGLAIQVQG